MSAASGGEAVAQALAAAGVEVVWGIPGTHNLPIYAGLSAIGIRHVLPRHEQGAVFAADGYARASGRPGVCVTTSGPATLNAVSALGQAWSDSVPVLLISAGMPLRHPGRGNGYLHETKDLGAALGAVVAFSRRLTSVAEIPVAIAQAFAAMTTGRPRPVHLEIPLDVLDERGEARSVPVPAAPLADPGERAITAAAELLAGAERPAIIAGGGAAGAPAELARLAERLGAPVVTTFNGKGIFPEDHPLSGGAGLHRAGIHELVAESDVLTVVGSELSPADLWEGPLPSGPAVVRIDIDPEQLLDNVIPAAPVAGDAARVLAELISLLGEGEPGAGAWERAAGWHERLGAEGRGLGARWAWILDPIAAALGRDGILAGDSTTACYFGAVARLPRFRPRSFLYPTGFGTLGYGLPAAIGAKLACPQRRVLALMGDGGVMFTLSELAAAAGAEIPLPLVVVDNGGYGEIRDEMIARGEEAHAVDLPAVDFVAVARGLGCDAAAIASAAELDAALERAFEADRPTLLHIRVEDGPNAEEGD